MIKKKKTNKNKNSQFCALNILLEAAVVAWLGRWQLGSDGPFQRVTAELGQQQRAGLQRWWWDSNTAFLRQGPSQRQTKRVAQTSEWLRWKNDGLISLTPPPKGDSCSAQINRLTPVPSCGSRRTHMQTFARTQELAWLCAQKKGSAQRQYSGGGGTRSIQLTN